MLLSLSGFCTCQVTVAQLHLTVTVTRKSSRLGVPIRIDSLGDASSRGPLRLGMVSRLGNDSASILPVTPNCHFYTCWLDKSTQIDQAPGTSRASKQVDEGLQALSPGGIRVPPTSYFPYLTAAGTLPKVASGCSRLSSILLELIRLSYSRQYR